MERQVIVCPQCGTEIDVNEVLYRNISKELEREYIEKNNISQKEYEKKLDGLKKSEEDVKKRAAELNEKIDAGVSEKLKSERLKLENDLRTKIEEEKSGDFKLLHDELNRKSEQISVDTHR